MTLWTAARQASLSFTVSQSLLKLMCVELVLPPNHLILCRPLLLLPSIFANIRVFSSGLVLHIKWTKYWSFSFSISYPRNIQSWFPLGLTGLISLQSKVLSRVFSSSTIWKHQFFGTLPSWPQLNLKYSAIPSLRVSYVTIVPDFFDSHGKQFPWPELKKFTSSCWCLICDRHWKIIVCMGRPVTPSVNLLCNKMLNGMWV